MKDMYLGFKFSFSYFSILPISFKNSDDLSKKNILNFMILFFPLVGFVLSIITIFIYELLTPMWYSALLCSVLYMFLYGFLHTEAIADVTDALYASHGTKDSYEVIKEPTIGAMGLLYTVSFLILKISSLTLMLLNSMYIEFIVVVILSRLSVVLSIYFNEFKSTFVNSLKDSINKNIMLLFSLIYISIGIILLHKDMIIYLAISLLVSYLFITSMHKKLNFLNGDVLGANLELNELILFIGLILYMN